MLYRVRHITEYLYQSRVSHCYNMAHVTPRSTSRQDCLSSRVDVSPSANTGSTRVDYFGNRAYHFEIQKPHKKLVITSVSEVRTNPQRSAPELELGINCKEAKESMSLSLDPDVLFAREYVMDSAMIKVTSELEAYARDLFTDDKPLLTAVMELTTRIFEEFDYSPAATTIATPISEVMETKKGVCQDFAHVQIGCLRSLGFAARYISGYLETLPPPGQEKLVGADATHAWLAVYIPGEGWVEFDPTNNCMAHEQHVVTAWGRDFYDVTPLCGVIYGGGSHPTLNVSVDVARI